MEPKLKPKFLEILAHPLRQQILVYIEQEGETGYKDLKNKFNVATGTLYHHLRFLKGLIEQNSSKKYYLTAEGRKALNVIFQDEMTEESLDTPLKSEPTPEVESAQETNEIIEESSPIIQESRKANGNLTDQNVIATVQPVTTTPETQIKAIIQSKTANFFNIKDIINSVPNWFYIGNIIAFFILPIILFFIQPKIVFFHFIPIKISNSLYSLVMFIFPIFNFIILFIISFIKQERVTISTVAILVIYYNIIFIFTIILNVFNLLENSLILHAFSILIQALFIIFWTLSISLQYYSWERSLFLAIAQNYILFLFF